MSLAFNQAIYGKPEIKAVIRVLKSQWLSGHKETALYEDELAKWWGRKYCVSTNSGSSANFIAVQALGLPEGTEVITPAGGAFPTTIAPLIYLKLKPVFTDIDLDTLCINLDEVEVSENTKAVIFAHTLGRMPDMDRVMKFVKKHNLKLIEDCADALGSKQNGKKAGTYGDLATLSTYPAHLFTTGGEGGAVVMDDYSLYRKCLTIRDWGRACYCRYGLSEPACGNRFINPKFDHRYYYIGLGLNFKLTEMQATFGREQLKRIDGFIAKRKRNYKILQRATGLGKIDEEINPFCFPFLAKDKQKTMVKLSQHGIGVRTIFSGNILKHPGYKNIDCHIAGDLRNSDILFNQSIFVGVGPHLTIENMRYIAKTIKEVL